MPECVNEELRISEIARVSDTARCVYVLDVLSQIINRNIAFSERSIVNMVPKNAKDLKKVAAALLR